MIPSIKQTFCQEQIQSIRKDALTNGTVGLLLTACGAFAVVKISVLAAPVLVVGAVLVIAAVAATVFASRLADLRFNKKIFAEIQAGPISEARYLELQPFISKLNLDAVQITAEATDPMKTAGRLFKQKGNINQVELIASTQFEQFGKSSNKLTEVETTFTFDSATSRIKVSGTNKKLVLTQG